MSRKNGLEQGKRMKTWESVIELIIGTISLCKMCSNFLNNESFIKNVIDKALILPR